MCNMAPKPVTVPSGFKSNCKMNSGSVVIEYSRPFAC